MKLFKRWLALLLAALLAFTTLSLAEETAVQTQEAQLPEVRLHTDKAGNVVFMEGAADAAPVMNMEDAAYVVASMSKQLGGDERTQFEPWRTLEDSNGNKYYVFRQMYADTTVSGGAVKVVTDASGRMLGLVSSVEAVPAEAADAGITAAEAEAVVLSKAPEAKEHKLTLVPGQTARVILPVALELDLESDAEKEESRFVWVVYSDNPTGSVSGASDLPYLAHYVAMNGEYLYSLPTIIPGDEAGSTGFDASYVFEFMEPASYTGTVTLSTGQRRELTVELMRDTRTGMYYLGNLERRIVVADCYEFLYNKGSLVLVASADNSGWDDTCLLSLYNYCKAWDYYKAIGWTGGDGEGTPMVILKDFCDQDHKPVDNAAYAGKYYGWQVFLSSSANDFSQCLDVLAHEFTHCVTGSVMTYNAYKNDFGAINEAMSDIQGKICEKLMEGGDDPEWVVGINSRMNVRCMSDPHRSSQPEYSWDLYYAPRVKTPTALNDRGGVHTNSSLLNRVAYRLCEQGGMTLEEARAYWFAVDCSMVPGTDYAQLSLLLPWVLKNLGMDRYQQALEAAIDAVRLRTDEMPTVFDQDRALLTLQLPDTELFSDGHWGLVVLSVDVAGFVGRVLELVTGTGEGANAMDGLMNELGIDPAELERLQDMKEEDLDTTEEMEALAKRLLGLPEDASLDEARTKAQRAVRKWLKRYIGEYFYFATGGAGQDGRTIRMVCRPGLTVPVLVRMEVTGGLDQPQSVAGAAYIFGQWVDLLGILDAGENEAATDAGMDTAWLDRLFSAGETDQQPEEDAGFFGFFRSIGRFFERLRKELFFEIPAGQAVSLPADGLETLKILEGEELSKFMTPLQAEEPHEEPAPLTERLGLDLSGLTKDELVALREALDSEIAKKTE